MVEFSLVGIVFLVLIIALFDFVRFLTVQSILRSAASRALSQASVIEYLDADCPSMSSSLQASCPSNRVNALRTVLSTLQTLPLGTLVAREPGLGAQYLISGTAASPAAEIILSAGDDYRAYLVDGRASTQMGRTASLIALDNAVTAASSPTIRSVLEREPIQVNLRARFRPMLGILGEFPVEATAAGFREIRGLSSFPARVDCRGIEVPIGQTPTTTNCPCATAPGNNLLIQSGTGCICANSQMTTIKNESGAVVNCACPENKVLSGANCVCPSGNCPTGFVLDSKTCACKCPNNQVEGSNGCTCTSPLLVSGDRCVCPANPICTNSGGSLNDTTCKCDCPSTKPLDPATGKCTCPFVKCEGGTVSSSCRCRCPSNFSNINGVCTCPPLKQRPDGTCACPTNIPCAGGSINSSCKCECPSPSVLNSSGTGCQCPPASNCSGGTYNSGCYCECPGDLVLNGKVCGCPSGQIQSGNTCACPSNQIWNGTNCVCPSNQQFINNVCQCPAGTKLSDNGSCFKEE